jgi:transposase-like protein
MLDFRKSSINSALRKVLKRFHYPLEVMLTCVRWYVAYPLSLRHVEEMMQERGVFVDHSTVHRWAVRMLPVLAGVFRRRKRPVGRSWRMDETYIKVSGKWKYLYRAVDRDSDSDSDTVDFLLTAKRDLAAARRFLERAINLHDVPEKITIDKSGANTAAIESVKANACVDIVMRQNKYLNNIVEQDHRAIKRITRPMLGFKSFWSARIIIAGIEIMHMIRKGQMDYPAGQPMSAAHQFYSLAV